MRGRRPLYCLALLLLSGVARAETTSVASSLEQPWERSVQLEKAGDLRGAEAIMVAAWGKKPNNFYAQLRLAYLALITKRANAAVARYARARRFPEAEGDADATAGYAAALALKGWQLAEVGRLHEARARWQAALAVEPEQPDALAGLDSTKVPITEPEIWGAMVGQSFGSSRYQGLAVFAQLPWRFFDRLTLRVAARHIEWRQISSLSPWAFGSQPSASWAVNEIYGGAGYDTPTVTAEALGFAITSASTSTISGIGTRLRVGYRWGASADIAALRSDGHWANEQARPAAFLVIDPRFVIHAGIRLTHDERANWASGVAGVSFRGGPVAVYLQGHLGTEHWSANLTSPSVLSIMPRTRGGGNVTILWDATRTLRVAGQGEAYALETDGATGTFWSVSLGLQLRIFGI